MNIRLHIERLVLDGLPIPAHEMRHVPPALESELARLLRSGGLAEDLTQGGAREEVRTRPLHPSSGTDPRTVGKQIAQSLYTAVGRAASAHAGDG